MKRTLILLSTAALLALMVMGCEDDIASLASNSPAIDRVRVGELTFTLQILNMQGEPQAVFREGDNFQFQFIMENKGDTTYTLPVYWYFPITNEAFFALNRRTQESGGIAFVGKSFTFGANTNDASRIDIPANDALVFRMPWQTENDTVYHMPLSSSRRYVRPQNMNLPSLKSGEYFTGFTLKYTDTDSVRMEVSFIVE